MGSNTMMSICFTLSPSMENVMPTRATMKFAQDACGLKMKPVADTGGKNWQKLYEKAKADLRDKDKTIEELHKQIEDSLAEAETLIVEGDNGELKQLLETLYR